MSDTCDLLRNTIYPAIFDRADAAFPELRFTRRGNDWYSPLKMDGTDPKAARQDKTIITARLPSRLYEQGGKNVSFWDYVARREGLANSQDILKRLAELAGATLPSLDPEALKHIERQRRTGNLWAAIASYCQWCLQNTDSLDAVKVREYLGGRGYQPEHIEAMGLGFMPSRAKLFEYLGEDYAGEELEAIKRQLTQGSSGNPYGASWGIGETHKLIIPYTASGRIIGIVARTTTGDKPKYLYPSGQGWRRPELFLLNAIRGDKDLIITEGFFDALGASVVAGIENVVALGDTGLNKERIEEAVRRGARKITLCLDNDGGGAGGTEKALREMRIHAPDLPVYVALLPEGKDPDDVIKEQGPDALKKAIAEAVPGWKYREQAIINEYANRSKVSGGLTRKDEDAILEELIAEAATIQSPIDRDGFRGEALKDLRDAGLSHITEESFQKATEAIRQREREAKRDKDARALWADGKRLIDEGKTGDALKLLSEGARELQARGADYSGLLLTLKESDIQEAIKRQPDSLKSGYNIGADELLFPAGALSILAAPTSHGKSALLLNVLLNAAKEYAGKTFHFFSYEESREAVLIRALNNYADMLLSKNNRRTIRSYYRGDEAFGEVPADFLTKKASFFRELIEPGRVNIHYSFYTGPELLEAIRYLKDHGNAGGIFIDYMQLLNKPGAGNSRQEELKEICLDLKNIAIETGLPIILAAQFNREVTSPLKLFLQNIGEAGDIERAANLVLGIWNGNFKPEIGKTSEVKDLVKLGFDEGTLLKEGKLFIEILKNRDGEAGTNDFLSFNGNTGTVGNPKPEMLW